MRVHDLKCWPGPFHELSVDSKPYEVRRDDRGFKVGDGLLLREWDPAVSDYTGGAWLVEITCITRGEPSPLPAGVAVLGIKKLGGYLHFLEEEHPDYAARKAALKRAAEAIFAAGGSL